MKFELSNYVDEMEKLNREDNLAKTVENNRKHLR